MLARRGDLPDLMYIISAMETCDAYQPWHDKRTHGTFVRRQVPTRLLLLPGRPNSACSICVSRRLEHADQRGLRRGHVLLIEDCSEVKFPTTAQRRRGLGPVKKGNACGVLVHAMLAVDATSGYCLGPVGGDAWSRDGMNPVPHSHRPLAEREAAQVTVVVGGPRGRHVPALGNSAGAQLPRVNPGDGGPRSGWRGRAVRRGAAIPHGQGGAASNCRRTMSGSPRGP